MCEFGESRSMEAYSLKLRGREFPVNRIDNTALVKTVINVSFNQTLSVQK